MQSEQHVDCHSALSIADIVLKLPPECRAELAKSLAQPAGQKEFCELLTTMYSHPPAFRDELLAGVRQRRIRVQPS